jgi:hypothetical protein
MMIENNFIYIVLSTALIGTLLIVFWMRNRKFKKRMGNLYYIIPLIIIMVISGILIQETIWQVEIIQKHYTEVRQTLLERKWNTVADQLDTLQEENFVLVEQLSQEVINELKQYDAQTLDEQLAIVGYTDTVIQQAVDNAIIGVFFRDIVRETNDPFALIIGWGEEDSFIFSNFSQSCAVDTLTYSLKQEYNTIQGITGSDELAQHTLQKIVGLDVGSPSESYLFLQVEPREEGPVAAVTLSKLKDLFFAYKGDIERTFEGLEFLAPYYIYRDGSISGAPRLENRTKTDARIIGMISSFGYLSVLEHDISFQAALNYHDELLRANREKYAAEEQNTLIISLLIMGIIYVLLILFWLFMHMNVEDASNSSQ